MNPYINNFLEAETLACLERFLAWLQNLNKHLLKRLSNFTFGRFTVETTTLPHLFQF